MSSMFKKIFILLLCFLALQIYYRPSTDNYYFTISNNKEFPNPDVEYKALKNISLFAYKASYDVSEYEYIFKKPLFAIGSPAYEMVKIEGENNYYILDVAIDNKSVSLDLSYSVVDNSIRHLEGSFYNNSNLEEVIHYIYVKVLLENKSKENSLYVYTNNSRCFLLPLDNKLNILDNGYLKQISCSYFSSFSSSILDKEYLKRGNRSEIVLNSFRDFPGGQYKIKEPVKTLNMIKYTIKESDNIRFINIKTGVTLGDSEMGTKTLGKNCLVPYISFNDTVFMIDNSNEEYDGIKKFEKSIIYDKFNDIFKNGRCYYFTNYHSSSIFKGVSVYKDFISIFNYDGQDNYILIDKKNKRFVSNYVTSLVYDDVNSIYFLGELIYSKLKEYNECIIEQKKWYEENEKLKNLYFQLGNDIINKKFYLINNRIIINSDDGLCDYCISIPIDELKPIFNKNSIYYDRL